MDRCYRWEKKVERMRMANRFYRGLIAMRDFRKSEVLLDYHNRRISQKEVHEPGQWGHWLKMGVIVRWSGRAYHRWIKWVGRVSPTDKIARSSAESFIIRNCRMQYSSKILSLWIEFKDRQEFSLALHAIHRYQDISTFDMFRFDYNLFFIHFF